MFSLVKPSRELKYKSDKKIDLWILLLASSNSCETQYLHFTTCVFGHSTISPFLGCFLSSENWKWIFLFSSAFSSAIDFCFSVLSFSARDRARGSHVDLRSCAPNKSAHTITEKQKTEKEKSNLNAEENAEKKENIHYQSG